MTFHPRTHRQAALPILLLLLVFGFAVVGTADQADPAVLEALRAELIPTAGTETAYERPLSLRSLPWFIHWWYSLVPAVESDPRYAEALLPLVAPCCDDNSAFKCCCEGEDGQACNIIRSAKGLAAHLIHAFDFGAEDVQTSVLEWLHFARPDYYLAAALEERGIDPDLYDLTTAGSCYRMMCNTPISQGGCGGMKTLNEPALGGGA